MPGTWFTRAGTVVRVAVDIRDAHSGDREQLRKLLAAYLFEFDGRTGAYPYFDAYWEEVDRLPFLIEIDGEVAGICLVRRRDGGWSIAEFSVVPEQRRRGVGRGAVEVLAARARFDGAAHLEAKVHPNNREALPFWLKVGFHEVEGPGTGVIVTRRTL